MLIIVSTSIIVYWILKQWIVIVSNKNKRIMIIDDDQDITNLFAILLEYNGYIVDAYTNPIEGLNNFRKNSHDLIILWLNATNGWNDILSPN